MKRLQRSSLGTKRAAIGTAARRSDSMTLANCYFEHLAQSPDAMILSLVILGVGYLLFGLDPSEPKNGKLV